MKFIVLIFQVFLVYFGLVVTVVKSDCNSDILKCLGDFVTGFFHNNAASLNNSDTVKVTNHGLYADISGYEENDTETFVEVLTSSIKRKLSSEHINLDLEKEFAKNDTVKQLKLFGKIFKVNSLNHNGSFSSMPVGGVTEEKVDKPNNVLDVLPIVHRDVAQSISTGNNAQIPLMKTHDQSIENTDVTTTDNVIINPVDKLLLNTFPIQETSTEFLSVPTENFEEIMSAELSDLTKKSGNKALGTTSFDTSRSNKVTTEPLMKSRDYESSANLNQDKRKEPVLDAAKGNTVTQNTTKSTKTLNNHKNVNVTSEIFKVHTAFVVSLPTQIDNERIQETDLYTDQEQELKENSMTDNVEVATDLNKTTVSVESNQEEGQSITDSSQTKENSENDYLETTDVTEVNLNPSTNKISIKTSMNQSPTTETLNTQSTEINTSTEITNTKLPDIQNANTTKQKSPENKSENLNILKEDINSLNELRSFIPNESEFPELNEISNDFFYEDSTEDNLEYPFMDYAEYYKDVTLEDVDYKLPEFRDVTTGEPEVENRDSKYTNFTTCLGTSDVVTDVIGPWIAAIFIRNSTSDQFDYICDGAILDSKIVVTAARCITRDNTSVDVNDILVIVGKKSLQARGDNEAVYRVQKLKTHNNFSAEDNSNDLAVIYTDGDIVLNSDVQYACLQDDGGDEVEDALTTGWKVSGDLAAIYFEEDFEGCKQPSSDNIICNSYKEGETCPSHGSIYLVRSGDVWYLRGIRSSDPTQRGLCFDRSVQYTDLLKYRDWFSE